MNGKEGISEFGATSLSTLVELVVGGSWGDPVAEHGHVQ